MEIKLISSLIVLILGSNIVFAQPEKDSFYIKKADSAYNKIKSTKLNFAIPDAPAFKALGADPSEILRPSDAKAFALMIPNFFTGTTLTIPTAFAAEISPGLLISNYTINDYYNKRFLRGVIKTRFSFGTSQDSTSRKLAFGIRTTLFEDKDFKADRVFINEYVRNLFLKPINKAVEDSVKKFEEANPGALDGTIDMNTKRKEIKKAILDKMGQQYSNLPKTIDSLKVVYQKKYWNSTKIDFAYSYVGQSQDSLLKNLRPDKHIFWLVGAVRPGCDWAQILFSVNTKIFNLSGVAKNEWTVNSRFYIGKNSLKAFVESQYNKKLMIDNKVPSYEKSLFLNLGFEAMVYEGVWIHLGTGVQNYLDSRKKNELVGNLNVYLTLPQNFKF